MTMNAPFHSMKAQDGEAVAVQQMALLLAPNCNSRTMAENNPRQPELSVYDKNNLVIILANENNNAAHTICLPQEVLEVIYLSPIITGHS